MIRRIRFWAAFVSGLLIIFSIVASGPQAYQAIETLKDGATPSSIDVTKVANSQEIPECEYEKCGLRKKIYTQVPVWSDSDGEPSCYRSDFNIGGDEAMDYIVFSTL